MWSRAKRRATAAAPLASACLALALLLGLPTASLAAGDGPAPVEAERARLAAPVHGRGALLVPVRYPIQLAGHRLELRVSVRRPGHGAVRTWIRRARANAGTLRLPERRRSFVYVHRIDLSRHLTRLLRRGFAVRGPGGRTRLLRPRVRLYATAALDANWDGKPEIDSTVRETEVLPRAHAARRRCASVPLERTRPVRRIALSLPVCGARVHWRIRRRPEHGIARIRGRTLIYRSRRGFRGTESIVLRGRIRDAADSADRRAVTAPVQIEVEQATGAVVRAMGDSVTAGFGYYDDGSLMPFTNLLSCRPREPTYDDACSSNSTSRDSQEPTIDYAPDYGLSNNVSWAAQWANDHGVTNYENLAVSGSEPADWSPGGQLYATTQRIEAEDPDYILMTMGANPLLSDMLFGVDNMGCAIWSDLFGGYRECVEEAFRAIDLRGNLERLYRELVDNTRATVYLMQYHLSVPSSALAYSATQIAMMVGLVNQQISSAAAAVNPTRLRVIAPPHFDVGIDLSPVYPSTYSCSRFGYGVDGPSVQSEPTQDELSLSHPLSFCSGPTEGPPWVISGDTGIHPSAAGYAQMASRVPAPAAPPPG